MAKPRITKLSDPSNPYGGKKTPTRARTAAEKMDAISRSKAQPERRSPPKREEKERELSPYMKARTRAIDNAVEGKTKRKK